MVADLLSSNTAQCWPTGWGKVWEGGLAYGDSQLDSMMSALGTYPDSEHSLREGEGEKWREKYKLITASLE